MRGCGLVQIQEKALSDVVLDSFELEDVELLEVSSRGLQGAYIQLLSVRNVSLVHLENDAFTDSAIDRLVFVDSFIPVLPFFGSPIIINRQLAFFNCTIDLLHSNALAVHLKHKDSEFNIENSQVIAFLNFCPISRDIQPKLFFSTLIKMF